MIVMKPLNLTQSKENVKHMEDDQIHSGARSLVRVWVHQLMKS